MMKLLFILILLIVTVLLFYFIYDWLKNSDFVREYFDNRKQDPGSFSARKRK